GLNSSFGDGRAAGWGDGSAGPAAHGGSEHQSSPLLSHLVADAGRADARLCLLSLRDVSVLPARLPGRGDRAAYGRPGRSRLLRRLLGGWAPALLYGRRRGAVGRAGDARGGDAG